MNEMPTALDTQLDQTVQPTRFGIAVHAPPVSLTLGFALEGTSYDGFNLTARDNGYLDAGGWFWAQAKEEMTLQSFGRMSSLAADDNLVIAKKGTRIVGEEGVFISAGFGMGASPSHVDLVNKPVASGSHAVSHSAFAAGATIGAIDAFIGVSLLARAQWRGDQWQVEAPKDLTDRNLTRLAIAAGVTSVGLSVMGAIGAGFETAPPVPGVTVFGMEGVVVASPLTTSIYGLFGVMIGSLYPMVFGLETEMYAIRKATVSSNREVSLEAKTAVSVSGGKVDIAGKEEISIRAGRQVQVPPVPVPQTSDVKMTPTSITLDVPTPPGAPSKNRITMGADELALAHPSLVSATVGEQVVAVTEMSVSLTVGNGVALYASATSLDITNPKRVTIEVGDGGVDVAAGNTVVKGNRILLG